MARPEKVAAVEELTEQLSNSAATLLTDYRGLSVAELAELRGELRKAGATYKVVKNTMTRRAADEAGIAGLEDYLVGPTALVFCDEDPVAPSKAMRSFAKDHPELLVKAGFVDGHVLNEDETRKLADLESREELLTRLAGLMHGALANFVRLLQAPLTDMGRLIAALEDKGGASPDAASPAEAASDAGEAAASTVEDAGEAVADAAETAGAAAVEATDSDAAADAAETTADAAESVAERAADAAATAAETAAEAVESAAETVAETVEQVTDAVTGEDEPADAEADEATDTTNDATDDEQS